MAIMAEQCYRGNPGLCIMLVSTFSPVFARGQEFCCEAFSLWQHPCYPRDKELKVAVELTARAVRLQVSDSPCDCSRDEDTVLRAPGSESLHMGKMTAP